MPRRATKGRAEASLETREALLRAGMTAFADEGLDVPSLDSICERAGFTRGAFYVHFKDRQDFIAAVMDSLTAGFIDSMFGSKDQPSDITEIVTRFATAVTQGKYPIPGTVRLHHVLDACSRDKDIRERRASLYRSAMDVVGHSVREGQQAGTVRREVEAGQVGVLMLAIVLGIEVLTELKVPFGTMGAAATVLDLLRVPTAEASDGTKAPTARKARVKR